MPDKIFENLGKVLHGVEKGMLLSEHTTYKIGGPAQYFFVAKNLDDLIESLKIAKGMKLPVFIFAGGSNILVSDKGIKGLVIKISMDRAQIDNGKLFIESGAMLKKMVELSVENNLAGAEWAAGVPGTVGGAIYGNAQAFGSRISDNIESVRALNIKTLKIEEFSREQCQFSLKNSIFKKKKNLVIISAVFLFKKGNQEQIQTKIKEHLLHRKNGHPTELPSAGSTFVNPEKKIKNKQLLAKYPELNVFNNKEAIPAGFLIEKSGLQGKEVGGAQISPKHANFIVNTGSAKAKDVLALIKLARKKVKNIFGINLEIEVQFVGLKL